ncbi:unnamed protein product [Trifolium pratense]|uniref:Uncharacterized protein n=1 Tax=Trifolium pratense TaxID=57577 RepID=A0ACB0LGV9_TRIPR|nr:unnamed protein product [Trifolium pratense]
MRGLSNHCPLVLAADEEDWGPRPSRMLKCWKDVLGYYLFVREKWNSFQLDGWGGFVLKEKLKWINTALKDWHSSHTQNMPSRIESLKDRLAVLDEKGARSPTDEFPFEMGLRQGDPLSPFLFLLAAKGLHVLMEAMVERNLFTGYSVGELASVSVSLLQFADNTLLTGLRVGRTSGFSGLSLCCSSLRLDHVSDRWQWRADLDDGYTVRGAYQLLTTQDAITLDAASSLIWHRQVESAQHLFLSCSTFGALWSLVSSWIGSSLVTAQTFSEHFVQFTDSAGGFRARRSFMQLIWLACVWVVWTERNHRLFRGSTNSVHHMLDKIKTFSYRWLKATSSTLALNCHSWWKTPRGSVFGVLHEWFNEAFEMLTSQVGRLLEDQYLGYFMSGLKPQIRRRVRTLNPQTRMQMMRINKDVDEELREDDEDWRLVSKKGGVEKTGQKDWVGSFQRNKTGSIYSKDPSRVSNSGWSNLNSKAGSSGSNSNSTSSLASTSIKEGELRSGGRGVRSVHREEVAERRAKGLCFKCGGKWHPTQHKCLEKALRDLILGDAETINEDGEIVSMEEVQSEEEEEEEVQLDRKKLLGEVSSDPDIQKLTQEVLFNPSLKHGFVVKNGVLFYHNRLVISSKSPTIPLLLEEFHSTPTGGHSGFLRTYRRLADNLYWIGMQRQLRDFVRSCDTCQRQKYTATSPGGLIQPLPIPNGVWEDLSLDFISGLPKSKSYEAILVVVDRLSKYSHFILLKHPYSAKTIAEVFVNEIVRTTKDLGCVDSMGRILVQHHVPCMGKTPFEVVYGRQPPNILRFLSNETKVEAVALELSERDEALSQLKVHLIKAHEKLSSYANKKRRDLSFHVGEWVFLKLRPHRQQSVIRRINQKLAARFYGPFKIVGKKAIGNYETQGELPADLEVSDDIDAYPEQIMGSTVTVKEGVIVQQSLIKWKHKSLNDVTWEDNAFLAGQFPEFSLEDNDCFEGREC